jgi:hypothetical protein
VKEKEILLNTIRQMRQSRLEELRASVSEGPGTTHARYGYGPFWNRASLVLLRRERPA